MEAEAGVAEGRDGMEHSRERFEAQGVEDVERGRAPAFDDHGPEHEVDQEAPDLEVRVVEQALAHGHPVRQADAPAPEIEDQAGIGHDAQAPELDEGQDDDLPEAAELGAGVDHGQAGDAGRRGRGEDGVDPGQPAAGNETRGLVQQGRADEYDATEEEDRRGEGREDVLSEHEGAAVQAEGAPA